MTEPMNRAAGTPERGGRRALMWSVIGLVVVIPLPVLGIFLVILGLVLGVRAHRRARRAGVAAPGAVPAIVIGSIGAVVALVLGVLGVIFWDQLRTYSECMAGAVTNTARSDCREALEAGVRQRIGVD